MSVCQSFIRWIRILRLKIFRNTRISSFKVNGTCAPLLKQTQKNTGHSISLTVEILIRTFRIQIRGIQHTHQQQPKQQRQQQRNLSPRMPNTKRIQLVIFVKLVLCVCARALARSRKIVCEAPVVFIICIFSCVAFIFRMVTLFRWWWKCFSLVKWKLIEAQRTVTAPQMIHKMMPWKRWTRCQYTHTTCQREMMSHSEYG